MDIKLTDEESLLLAQMEKAGKWDNLISDLSIMCPSFIIIAFGIHFDSAAAIITGMAVYAGFSLRTPLHQAKIVPIMKSLAKKVRQSNNGPQPTAAASPSLDRQKVDGQ